MAESLKSLSILFVCTGNTCRSVFAEYLMKKLCAGKDPKLASAGIYADPHFPIPESVIKLLKEEGVSDFNHTPKMPTKEMVSSATHIYAMEERHKKFLLKNFPEASAKVFLLSEDGISDPMGGNEQIYRDCLKKIKEALAKIMKILEENRVP